MDGAGIAERFLEKRTLEWSLEGQRNIGQAEEHGAERTAVGAERRKRRDSVHAGGAAALRWESKASVDAAETGGAGRAPGRLRGAYRV